MPDPGLDVSMVSTALVVVSVVLACLPLAMVLWNLVLFRRFDRASDRDPRPVSVLIPARDEERRLPALLEDLAAQRGVEFEVVVLDDQSTDGTVALIDRVAAGDARFRRITGDGPPPGWNGKQAACQRLAEAARFDRLLFLDADLRMRPDALRRITVTAERLHSDDPNRHVGLISGFPRLETRGFLERLLLPQIHFVLLGYLPLLGMRRSRSESFGAGCGQCFCTDKASYERAGGHAAIRASRHDGVKLPRAFRRARMRTDLFDASDCLSVRMYESPREVWQGLSKNAEEGLGGPVAIWVWTVLLGLGTWLPLVLLISGASDGSAVSPAWLWSAFFAASVARLALAWRLRQDPLSAALHPFGVLVLLALQWHARWKRKRGQRVEWKQRAV